MRPRYPIRPGEPIPASGVEATRGTLERRSRLGVGAGLQALDAPGGPRLRDAGDGAVLAVLTGVASGGYTFAEVAWAGPTTTALVPGGLAGVASERNGLAGLAGKVVEVERRGGRFVFGFRRRASPGKACPGGVSYPAKDLTCTFRMGSGDNYTGTCNPHVRVVTLPLRWYPGIAYSILRDPGFYFPNPVNLGPGFWASDPFAFETALFTTISTDTSTTCVYFRQVGRVLFDCGPTLMLNLCSDGQARPSGSPVGSTYQNCAGPIPPPGQVVVSSSSPYYPDVPLHVVSLSPFLAQQSAGAQAMCTGGNPCNPALSFIRMRDISVFE